MRLRSVVMTGLGRGGVPAIRFEYANDQQVVLRLVLENQEEINERMNKAIAARKAG